MFKYKYKFFHVFDGLSKLSNICNPALVFICILIGSGHHLHLYNLPVLSRFSRIIFSLLIENESYEVLPIRDNSVTSRTK